MKKFILYSNQLNIYYLNLINDSKDFGVGGKPVPRTEKEDLLLKIKSEVKTIAENVRLITGHLGVKKSSKVECHFCRKRFSPKLLSTHLSEHLDQNGVNDTNRDINENINQTNVETHSHSNERPEECLQLLCPTEIKDEPLDEYSDDGSNWSANNCRKDNNSSDEESILSEKPIKTAKRKSKRTPIRRSLRSRRKSIKSLHSTESVSQSEVGIRCEECGKGFKCQNSLSIHLGSVHKKYKTVPNDCHLCDFRSINNKKFKRHMSIQHNIDTEKAKNFECTWPGCHLTFYYNTSLQRHIDNHQSEMAAHCQWPGCNRQYKSEKQLKDHMRVHTGEKPFGCHWPGCDRSFRHRGTLRSHMLTHDKDKVLKHGCHYPECGRTYENKKLLRQHIFSVHEKDNKPFRCSYEGCGASFVANQNLQLHISTIHAENRVRYQCQHQGCKRSFFDAKQMERHMERPHGVRKRRTQNGPKKKYVRHCDWPGCEYIAKYACKIKEHKQRTHTGEKPLKCEHPGCNFSAVRRFDMRVHLLKHTGETPYPCEYPDCGRRFKSQRALDTHSAKNHPPF